MTEVIDAPPMQSLGDAFKTALAERRATSESSPETKREAPKEQPKETKAEVKQEKQVAPEQKEAPKETPKETPKAEAPKRKSALDAALSEEVATPTAEPDEVEQLISAKDPNWAKTREVLKSQSQKVKDLEAKLAQSSAPAPEVQSELKTLKAERERLESENKQMRDSIMALDVRYDPQTQSKISSRDKQAESLAARVGEAGGNKEAFLEALNLPLSKRSKALDVALEGIESARELSTINAKLSSIEIVDEEIDEMLSKPHQTFEEMKRQREVQAREQNEKIEQFKTATFDSVKAELPKLSKFMRPSSDDAEGAKEFNEALLSDLQKAPTLLDVEPRDAAVAAYKAARYDSVEKIALGLHSRVNELEAQLAKYERSEPGFSGGAPDTKKPAADVPIGDSYRAALANLKGS